MNSNYANCSDCMYNFLDIPERHFAEQLTRMDRVCIDSVIIFQNEFILMSFITGCFEKYDSLSMSWSGLVKK